MSSALNVGVFIHHGARLVSGVRHASETLLRALETQPGIVLRRFDPRGSSAEVEALTGRGLDLVWELESDAIRALAVRAALPVVAPICLLAHGNLGGAHAAWWYYAPLLLGGFAAHDVVVVTSTSARAGMHEHLTALAEQLPGAGPPPRLVTLPLAVDVERFVPRERAAARGQLGWPERPTVLLHGRIDAESKLDPTPLVEVMAQLAARLPVRPRLVVSTTPGNPAARGVLGLARARGLGDLVQLLEGVAQSDVPLLYAAADVALCASDNMIENFGLTAVEAMACGRPVVAPDWGGLRDIVQHGATGLLVPTVCAELEPGAELLAALGASWGLAVQAQATAIDLDGLVQALAELLEDPARAAQLGATGRRRALECYAMPVVAAQLGALWREQVERCAALREAAAAPRRPALQLTLARGFRAMPTRWLDGADAVVLTELGRAALAGAVPIVVGAIPGDAVDSGLLRQLLQRVAREAAWLELAALPDLRAVRHVAWLLKQGYLRQHPPASP